MTSLSPLIKRTIMSQYANSPVIMRMIEELSDAIDPNAFISDFYRIVMNINTAEGVGLDIWGRIVGVDRVMGFPDPEGEFFGFSSGFYTFNDRPFSGGSRSAYELPDGAYRQLIIIKAMANIIYATAPNINKLMKAVFNKKCYFLIVGHMAARYVFEFRLTPFERHIVYNLGILPRPCGVGIEVLDAIPPETFGFYGSGFTTFNHGVFYNAAT